MFISVDPSKDVPIFRQIVQQIKTAVAMGRLQPEEPLPSVRQLAVELAVNPNTVARAYLDLEIEGVIYKRQGAGTFVSGQGVRVSREEQRRVLGELFERALVEGVNLGMDEGELRETFERVLGKVMQEREPEAVGS